LVAALNVHAADQTTSDTAQEEMLLTDAVGQAVSTPTSSVAPGLRPASALGLKYQTPNTQKGVRVPSKTLDKLESVWESLPPNFDLFPSAPPRQMPYLYNVDALGNTAVAPGPLLNVAPLEPEVQHAKYWLSGYGLRYSFQQTFTYASMTDVVKGDDNLAKYNLNVPLKWTVFDAPSAGTAGWLSAQVQFQSAIGDSPSQQTAKTNLGTLTNPTGFWSTHSSFRVPELAWQQSFDSGHIVALAGVINQTNYFDANAYANTGRGQFINSALINSMVLPLPAYNYALDVQWQPTSDWYTMLGYSVGNASAGQTPGTNFSWANWSLEWEIGYAPSNFLGLGPGVYRIQPFIGRAGSASQVDASAIEGRVTSSIQGGLGFDLQQQLGANSPFGWFGRFGHANSQVSAGAKTQVGTGFIMLAPLEYVGWVPRLNNNLLGAGFVWSQPSATTKTIYHENEYVFETFYTLQLTPLSRLQPDLQLVWDPVFSRDPGPAVVFQIQFLLRW
jgi:carbohydrate-selective porin OprB